MNALLSDNEEICFKNCVAPMVMHSCQAMLLGYILGNSQVASLQGGLLAILQSPFCKLNLSG